MQNYLLCCVTHLSPTNKAKHGRYQKIVFVGTWAFFPFMSKEYLVYVQPYINIRALVKVDLKILMNLCYYKC